MMEPAGCQQDGIKIMKKLKKILLWAGIGLLVLVIAAAILVGLFLGRIVKYGVETVGPKLTQTTIKLDSVDLSLLTGSARVKGLVIGNPKGYKAPNAISVGSAVVSFKPMSVLSDKIIVKYVNVEAPEIAFEGNPLGQNNLKKILSNVNAAVASLQAPAAAKKPAKPGKKLEVDEFRITGARVHLGTGITIPLQDIEFHDLGRGSNGITPAELAEYVLAEVVSDTIKAVSSATNIGRQAGKVLGDGFKAIKKGIGDLFGK
jgi:uncharacterized protein involved in outer membrane biogenesis